MEPPSFSSSSFRDVHPDASPAPTRPAPDRSTAVEHELAHWDRYQLERLLGQGGMGSVYLARDRRLGRRVALKLLATNDPALAHRFLPEARAQARIDHDLVCKVYEAGEIHGRPYIAMEFIDGPTLEGAHHQLSLEQKVRIVHDTALALQAAHHLGIIHRDLKPANILLDRHPDGTLRPVLTDFGLARDLTTDERMTHDGVIVGTPAYMSPEQISGSALDRRSDIYGLGVVLYELVTGRVPFSGPLAQVFSQVVFQDPPPPRRLTPSLPRDLETIVLKCLHKEPQHRYPSMLELARDLARYLAGEPLSARRTSWSHRLLRHTRRHKALTLMAAATVLSLGLALAQTLLSRHRAARRTELAAELGQEIQRIETFVHVAHTLPLHDVRREHRVIGERIADLAMRLHALDAQLQGPLLYALGRGHLALQAPERAASYLEETLARGYDTPEVHYSLGRALGQRFMLEAAQARRHPDPAEVDRRLHTLETQYLTPARAHLERARPQALTVDSRAYVEALGHYLARDFAGARERTARAQTEAPWRYETFALEGDIHSAEAEQAFRAGHYDQASALAERALAPYQRALDMARSDPELHLNRARAWHLITVTRHLRGADLAEPAEHLRQEAQDALTANPDAVAGYQYLAAAHLHRARHLSMHDVDPRPAIQLGLTALAQALERRDDDSTSHSLAAELSILQGQYLMNFGQDPRPTYARALGHIRRGLTLDPHDAFLWRTCVTSQVAQMQYETRHGIDPRPRLAEVRRCSREGLAQSSLAPALWLGLSQAHFTAAQYLTGLGQDPRPLLAKAHDAIVQAIALDPHPAAELGFPAHFYSLEARYLLGEGQDAAPAIAAGLTAAAQSLALLPRSSNALMALTRLAGHRAQSLVERSDASARDFAAAIAAGQAAAARWQTLQPRLPERFAFEAYLEMTEARWQLRHRQRATARPHLMRAITLLQQGLALQGRNAFFHPQLAEAYLICATDTANTPASAREHLDRGLAIIAQGLGVNPHQPTALALQGALLWARAQRSRTPAETTPLAERARLSFEAALARNPSLARQYHPTLAAVHALLARRPHPSP